MELKKGQVEEVEDYLDEVDYLNEEAYLHQKTVKSKVHWTRYMFLVFILAFYIVQSILLFQVAREYDKTAIAKGIPVKVIENEGFTKYIVGTDTNVTAGVQSIGEIKALEFLGIPVSVNDLDVYNKLSIVLGIVLSGCYISLSFFISDIFSNKVVESVTLCIWAVIGVVYIFLFVTVASTLFTDLALVEEYNLLEYTPTTTLFTTETEYFLVSERVSVSNSKEVFADVNGRTTDGSDLVRCYLEKQGELFKVYDLKDSGNKVDLDMSLIDYFRRQVLERK